VILVDTSIWVDHLRKADPDLKRQLDATQVLAHPFIIGELALGILRQRDIILAALRDLPQATVASDHEVLEFIEAQKLSGSGIGYVDAHLLAATKLSSDAVLWTRDRRLREVAEAMGLAAQAVD
jgi:predicted nucleic acid-binding protein